MDDIKELLKQVKRIEIRSRQDMDDLTAGAYRSRFKGQGMAFEDVREYVPGDDVRHIDWNVSARAGHPYVKVFREEREMTVLLVVDCSGSMRFGAIPGFSSRSKMATAAEAAAMVAITALANKDQIGLLVFSDRCERHLAPRRGRNHILRLVREIIDPTRPPRSTDLTAALDEVLRTQRRRTVCFLVSDFLNLDERFAARLQRVRRKHDLIGIRIDDPAERELPKGTWPLALEDPETGNMAVLADNLRARERYRQAWLQQRERCRLAFLAAACDLLDCDTESSTLRSLQRFFSLRRRRIRV